MSVLTKVFVLLLSVFSIALSMLVVAAFAKQENWKESCQQWQQTALAAQGKERAAIGSAIIDKQHMIDQHQRDLAKLNELQTQLNGKEAKLAEAQHSAADAQSKLDVEQGTASSLADQTKLIQSTLNSEREFAGKLARRNSELERGNIDLTDRVKELTVNVEMARSQVRALQQQIASGEETRSSTGSKGLPLADSQTPGGNGIVEPGMPSVEPIKSGSTAALAPIRGEIKSIRGTLAEISIGTSAGVSPGMTFLVYRRAGQGKAQFLATLKVSKVEANSAAGEIEQSEGDIKPGDSVRDEASFAMSR